MNDSIIVNDINISDYNKISKDILTIGTIDKPLLTVRHVIGINKKKLTNNEKTPHYFEYMSKADYVPYSKVRNVIFTKTLEYIQIESKINQNINSQYNEFVKTKLFYKDFVETKKVLNEVEKWYEDIKDLYTVREYNNTIVNIKSTYKELIKVVFFKGVSNRFISFQPSIVYDNSVTYPGVEIKCDQGVIANISLDEYLTLKLALFEYINNFNMFSVNMLQLMYLHCIGSPKDMNIINK